MAGVPEQQFLETIRKAIGNRQPVHEYPSDHEVARVVKRDEDVVERFCRMAVEAKVKLHRVAGENALAGEVVAVLKEIGARSVLVTDQPFPQREAILAAIRGAGVALADLKDNDCAFTADAGLVLSHMGVAETGSIAINSGSNTRRLASLAVPEHIAVLSKSQIVADLLDWAERLGKNLVSNEVLITGPSKTADIEMNLVMGVHGPKNVHLLLIE